MSLLGHQGHNCLVTSLRAVIGAGQDVHMSVSAGGGDLHC